MNHCARPWTFLAVAVLAMACGHTQAVSDKSERKPPSAPSQSEDERAAHHHHGNPHTNEQRDRTTRQAAAPAPLATSPAGLLKPGAAKQIQNALVNRRYLADGAQSGQLDAPTEKALRSFQQDNKLPATGVPDDATIEKLGISPGEVFRANPSE